MPVQKETILVTEPLIDAPLAWLRGQYTVVEGSSESTAFASAASRAIGLVVRTYTRVDASLLDRLPQLRVVARAGVGVDNIDLVACAARAIPVVHTPDANTQAVVEYLVSLLAGALRPPTFLDQALTLAQWEALRSRSAPPRQMSEMTLGILGCGRIGRRVAQVATAIGFRVLFNDIVPIDTVHCGGATRVDLDQLCSESDVLTFHIDGRPSNRHFVCQRLFDLMRTDVTIVNTCRGMVVDQECIARFLRSNPTAQALLDVHEPEPITSASPLLGLRNAHLAPHLASRTATAMANMSWVVRDVVEVLEGRPPSHQARIHAACDG